MPAPTQSIIDSGQCSIVTNNTYDTTGTLTKSDLLPATPAQVLTWFYTSGTDQWNPIKTWCAHQFEMQMCGIQRMGFWDWIMSGMKDLSPLWTAKKVSKGPGLIEPFIFGMQDSVLNDESWTITAGWRAQASGNAPYSDTGTTYTASSTGPIASLTGGDRVIRVSPKYTLLVSAQYFLAQYKVLIQSLTGAGVTQTSVYRIVAAAAEAATPPTYVDLLLDAETDNSAAAWFNSAPTSGIIRLVSPNITDWESYCLNRLNVNTKKKVPFWVETTRQVRKVGSEYAKVRELLLNDNCWFAQFVDLSDAERNRQDEMHYRRELVNALLFQEPISANQTLALWGSLTQINSATALGVTPGTEGQLMAYKANLVGVLPQLRSCGQALDWLNNPLDIKSWVETYLYPLYRARKTAGRRSATSIDTFTDSDSAGQAEVAMVDWYKDRYGATATINLDAISSGENAVFGFSWRSFKIPTKPAGVRWNVIVHEAFDDLKDALGASYEQAGRYLWTVDFNGTVYPAIVGSNHRSTTVGDLNDLGRVDSTMACVMENPTEHIEMNSQTLTMVVECPLQSRVDYGFSNISYTP